MLKQKPASQNDSKIPKLVELLNMFGMMILL